MIGLGSNKNDVIYEQPLTYKVTIMTMTGKKRQKRAGHVLYHRYDQSIADSGECCSRRQGPHLMNNPFGEQPVPPYTLASLMMSSKIPDILTNYVKRGPIQILNHGLSRWVFEVSKTEQTNSDKAKQKR